MDLQLTGKRALVTGSSAGVGRAIAARLALEGCAVLIHGRRARAAEQVAAEIRASGGSATVLLGDLTEEVALTHVVDQARENGVDILVNNAGPFREHSWDTVDGNDWIAAFQGNVVSAAQLSRGLTPAMRESGWGRVVNIGSRAVTSPLENMVEYSAAKAAVVSLTASLAKHLAHSGVTANCVSPGVILTPSLQAMFTNRSDNAGKSWGDIEPVVTADYAPNPAGRLGRPGDIAAAVAFLASPLASYINGVNLPVDGGITGTV